MSDLNLEPAPAQVLGYATPDADGLPEWIDSAERAVDRGVPPKQIRQFFRKADEATRYFAKSMRRRFPLQRVGSSCDICGTTDEVRPCSASWRVQMPLKTFEFKLWNRPARVAFKTFHALCPRCRRRWRWKRIFRRLGGALLTIMFIAIWLSLRPIADRLHVSLDTAEKANAIGFWCLIVGRSILLTRRGSIQSGPPALRLPVGMRCHSVEVVP